MPGRMPAALLALVALLLSACASIPSHGAARQAQVDKPGTDLVGASVLEARGPSAGMTPQDLLDGFRLANADFGADFTAPRAFLTDLADAQWAPRQSTLIYDRVVPAAEEAAATAGERASLTLRVKPLGLVDSDGHYRAFVPGSIPLPGFAEGFTVPDIWTWEVRFLRERGEWRIANPPPGVAVQSQLLSGVLSRYEVWFATPPDPAHAGAQSLVPDPVELSAEGGDLLTELAGRLLAGPSVAMQGAVVTGFPPQTRLRGSVRLESGTAVVDVTRDVLSATTAERGLLVAQLQATLTQVPGVGAVRLSAEGDVITAAPSATTTDALADDPAHRILFATKDGVLQSLESGKATPYPVFGNDSTGAPRKVRRPAISSDGRRNAALTPGPAPQLMLTGDELGTVTTLRVNGGFGAPGFDRRDVLWTVGLGRHEVMAMGPGDTVPYVVSMPASLAGRVMAVEPARDGARVALIVKDEDVQKNAVDDVYVAAVVQPVGSSQRLTLGPAVAVLNGTSMGRRILDLAWSNAETLAVLGGGAESERQVQRVDIGQPNVGQGPGQVAGGDSIAARPAPPDDVVWVGTIGKPDGLPDGLSTINTKNSATPGRKRDEGLTDPAFRS